jgi:hypothetical protein
MNNQSPNERSRTNFRNVVYVCKIYFRITHYTKVSEGVSSPLLCLLNHNSILFFIISVLHQQPEGQLQMQHKGRQNNKYNKITTIRL